MKIVEIRTFRQIEEVIEKPGDISATFGVKTSHSYKGFCQGQINRFMKSGNKEREMMARGFLNAYLYFHPETSVKVPIESSKGFSGVEIKEYPTYFETIQYRKTDGEIKKIRHKILKYMLKYVQEAIERLRLNEKVHTRYIAQEYVKNAKIDKDSKGRPYFDEKGWNFAMFFGCRSHYTPFNLCLKILEHYGFIKYYKNGEIERLKEKMEIQSEFS